MPDGCCGIADSRRRGAALRHLASRFPHEPALWEPALRRLGATQPDHPGGLCIALPASRNLGHSPVTEALRQSMRRTRAVSFIQPPIQHLRPALIGGLHYPFLQPVFKMTRPDSNGQPGARHTDAKSPRNRFCGSGATF